MSLLDLIIIRRWTISKLKEGIENKTEDEFIDYKVSKMNKGYKTANIIIATIFYGIGIIQMFLNDMGAINLVVSTLVFVPFFLIGFLYKKLNIFFFKKQLRKIYKEYGSFQYKI